MSQHVWTYPGGKKVIQKEQASPVAGNVAVTLTVPAYKMWLLLNVVITLTTDATAVNRYARVSTRDTANAVKFRNTSDAVTQSLGPLSKYFTRDVGQVGAVINALGLQILIPTEDVYLEIGGGVAGDTWLYLVEYLEIDMP